MFLMVNWLLYIKTAFPCSFLVVVPGRVSMLCRLLNAGSPLVQVLLSFPFKDLLEEVAALGTAASPGINRCHAPLGPQ